MSKVQQSKIQNANNKKAREQAREHNRQGWKTDKPTKSKGKKHRLEYTSATDKNRRWTVKHGTLE